MADVSAVTEMARLMDVSAQQSAELARLRAEVEMLRSAGVCELGAHNPAVAEYACHWEGRAETAERERDELRARKLDAQALIDACVPGGSICDPQAVADAIREYVRLVVEAE